MKTVNLIKGMLIACALLCLIAIPLEDSLWNDPSEQLVKAFLFAFAAFGVHYAYKCWETAD